MEKISESDKKLKALSWSVFGFVIFRKNKNIILLIIGLIIILVLFIPAIIYLVESIKRKRLVAEYVDTYINGQEEVLIYDILKDINYSFGKSIIYRGGNEYKNQYHLNADKTKLIKNSISHEEDSFDERMKNLIFEKLAIWHDHSRGIRRKREIDRMLVALVVSDKKTKNLNVIKEELLNNFSGIEQYFVYTDKYLTKLIKKVKD